MGRGQSKKGRRPTVSTSSLGQRIRDHRTALGLTQAQLGAPVYQGGYLSDVEHGRVTPSLEALEHISRRVGVEAGDLLGEAASPVRPADAMARAHRLITDAMAGCSDALRPVLAAAAITVDALRRQLTELES
jgi:transcriptional regulator with XRE-family HTH domain